MNGVFESMLRHMAWADRVTGEAIAACGERAETEEAIRLYAHIVAAETIWLGRLTGELGDLPPVFPEWSIAAAQLKAGEAMAGYEKFLTACSDFSRLVDYRTGSGTAYRTAVADILTHVFLHGSHHRGQINAKLRAAGFEPANVDYITFVRR